MRVFVFFIERAALRMQIAGETFDFRADLFGSLFAKLKNGFAFVCAWRTPRATIRPSFLKR